MSTSAPDDGAGRRAHKPARKETTLLGGSSRRGEEGPASEPELPVFQTTPRETPLPEPHGRPNVGRR
jgi:hypothetical protein